MFHVITITIAILASLACASAFSPSSVSAARSRAIMMSYENAIGVQPPLGFFDPLGLLKDASEKRFNRLRTVELKHGRISMLAVLGHIVTTAGVRLPGLEEMKTGLAVFNTLPLHGIFIVFHLIGLLELGFNARQEEIAEFCSENFPSYADDRRGAVELNNGRAAQMGILALMVHEKLDNNPYVINSLLGYPVAFN